MKTEKLSWNDKNKISTYLVSNAFRSRIEDIKDATTRTMNGLESEKARMDMEKVQAHLMKSIELLNKIEDKYCI